MAVVRSGSLNLPDRAQDILLDSPRSFAHSEKPVAAGWRIGAKSALRNLCVTKFRAKKIPSDTEEFGASGRNRTGTTV